MLINWSYMRCLILRARHTRWLLLVVLAALGLIVAACTASQKQDPAPSNENGNKAALCKFDTDFHEASKAIKSEADSLAVIKSFEPRYDQALADAPDAIKSDVETLINGLRAIARSNDLRAIDANAQLVSDAGLRIDTYCGISPR